MSRGVALGTALTPQALHAPRPAPFIVTVIDRMAEVSSSLWVCVICSIGPPRTGCPRPSPGVFGPSPRRRLQHLTPVPDSLGILCQCFVTLKDMRTLWPLSSSQPHTCMPEPGSFTRELRLAQSWAPTAALTPGTSRNRGQELLSWGMETHNGGITQLA